MKAYLLLCFLLLFYSINSYTEDNYNKLCEKDRRSCYNGCMKMVKTRIKECELRCKRNFFKCINNGY